ncbi:aldehyde dehydrogenase, dimeric NADP-preferring-like [Cylas formicarius]|uniref:aldehyde dehydrogenase, dimeric NADP-preferring-like n=1 Tax=Cylas formicarius TaxID=197179 RepID=UPI0029588EF1|nr:aldehyde dehydrogenase, dimeric NADP-preferring-like [Cylas formicarius]XP_060523096.1 aldehyde dehydrogenase, dimeric NADP-preferring-like [Cylas formicarius]XP_060523097.1 aldehyde dehydrogenase, dimeric NADP-preferring-like [Cylas formicarius]
MATSTQSTINNMPMYSPKPFKQICDELNEQVKLGNDRNGSYHKPSKEQSGGTANEVAVIDICDDGFNKKKPIEYVTIARRAFKTGRTKNFDFRKKQLKGLLRFLEIHRSDIEEAVHKDLRKHKQETNMCEIELVANDLRHTLIEFKAWASPRKPEKRLINLLDGVYVQSDPYGVVLIIGAWNYPILLTLGPLVGALAGGNTVILKPSELAPATNKLLSETLIHYLDTECFQILLGGISETTELLKEKFDYIFFTGSTKVGQIVHQAAAKNLTPTTLELGGKCPLYLDDTLNVETAARRIVWGRFLNSGQTCVAPDYIVCSKTVQDKFVEEAKKVLEKFYGSDPMESECLSKIVSEKHYKRLVGFLRSENIAVGGHCNPQKLLIAPTILINVGPHDQVMEEEIFGPILPILNVLNVREAIDFINSREKPLALYVFSNDKSVQDMFLTETSSGGVAINDTISHISTEGLPFGGVGASGMGSYHGKKGFETFTHQKGVLVKDVGRLTEVAISLRYPPYSDAKTKMINSILKRRRCIPFDVLGKLFLFLLGIAFAFGVQYLLS